MPDNERMTDESAGLQQVLPSPHLLDDLELIRQGVEVPLASDSHPSAITLSTPLGPSELHQVVVIEPEGVPIAAVGVRAAAGRAETYIPDGSTRFLSRRPDRPFESLHRSVSTVTPPDFTVVIDHSVNAVEAAKLLPAGATVLVLLVAAVERAGETQPREVHLCTHALHLTQELSEPAYGLSQVDLVVVPIASDHPHRKKRITLCAWAFSQGGHIVDLSEASDEPREEAQGAVLFFTGLSGSGKSTLAKAVRNRLLEQTERTITLLDGDVVRRHLSSGLGFGPTDRDINIRRIGWVAARIAEHGGLAICSPIAPFDATRQAVRDMTLRAGGRFVLIHIATPLEECERRDRKGLYARARRGEIPNFTGISSPYEDPVDPDLRLDTTDQDIEKLTKLILDFGAKRGLWHPINHP